MVAETERERLADAAEARAAGGEPRPRLTRARRDGWTQQRQRAFSRALADTGSYGQAAAAVGLSREAVRRFRHRSPAFQAMCDKAIVEGGTSLEDTAYIRAVEGWEEPVYQGGKLVGHRRRYSDSLLRALLRRDAQELRHKQEKWRRPKTLDEVRESILTKLEAIVNQDEDDGASCSRAYRLVGARGLVRALGEQLGVGRRRGAVGVGAVAWSLVRRRPCSTHRA